MLIYVCKFVMHCITLYCLSYVYIYILCILIVLLGYWNLINLLTYIKVFLFDILKAMAYEPVSITKEPYLMEKLIIVYIEYPGELID